MNISARTSFASLIVVSSWALLATPLAQAREPGMALVVA